MTNFYRFTKQGDRKAVDLLDLYSGSVVLCGGHPSLNEAAVLLESARRGVVIAAMNNAALTIRPDIWICADEPGCYSDRILLDPTPLKFCRMNYTDRLVDKKPWRDQSNTFFYSARADFKWPEFLARGRPLAWCKNVFMTALQILGLMGFTRIYLVGCVFNIEGDNPYAHGGKLQKKHVDYNQRTYNTAVEQFGAAYPYLVEQGVDVVNASEGSMLEKTLRTISVMSMLKEVRGSFPSEDGELPHVLDLQNKL